MRSYSQNAGAVTTPQQLLAQLQERDDATFRGFAVCLKLIADFQLEAWKEGMTCAAEIAGRDAILNSCWGELRERKQAILDERDAKT